MAGGLSGDLAQMPLLEMLRMLNAAGQTGRLDLADRAERGVIFLRGGEVVHAEEGPGRGEAAFFALAAWTAGLFRFESQVAAPAETVSRATGELLAEAAQRAVEQRAVRETIPSTDRVLRLDPRLPAAEVTLTPSEWEVIAAIGGGRPAAALPPLLGRDEFSVLRAVSQLVKAGLVQVEKPAEAVQERAYASPEFFRVLGTAAAAALGPMAQVIIDEEVAALGSGRETFPLDRVSLLIERVGAEIYDDDQRVEFQQKMLALVRRAA